MNAQTRKVLNVSDIYLKHVLFYKKKPETYLRKQTPSLGPLNKLTNSMPSHDSQACCFQ